MLRIELEAVDQRVHPAPQRRRTEQFQAAAGQQCEHALAALDQRDRAQPGMGARILDVRRVRRLVLGGASRRSFRQRATWLARSVPAGTVPWAREEGRPSSTRPSRQGNRRAAKGVGMSGRLSDRGAHIECKFRSMPAQDGYLHASGILADRFFL